MVKLEVQKVYKVKNGDKETNYLLLDFSPTVVEVINIDSGDSEPIEMERKSFENRIIE